MPIQHIKVLRGESSDQLKLAEGSELGPWTEDSALTIVGQPHSRPEGVEKVTGRAQYSSDVRLPGQLFASILRAPHPHARLLTIDTSAAAALPGVHVVLSSADKLDVPFYEEESPIFSPIVRFAGDEVAVVAAETLEIAEDALRLIEVTYEKLPFVSTLGEARQSGSTPVHGDSNVLETDSYERGDVKAGLKEADVVIEQTYTTQTVVHQPLESHGCTALWADERLTIWGSTQGIFQVREDIAEKLGLPEHHVRVIKQHMGGGFGAKQVAWKPSVLAALLAKKSGRPVQLMLDRNGESLAAGNRTATQQHVRIGAKKDGTLTAISLETYMAVGAYKMGGEASNVAGIYQLLYACPNVETAQTPVYTNTGPSVAFRSPGYVEGAFALESAMDELARKLDMDPLALRRHNYTQTDQKKDQPFTLPEALTLCYDRASEAFRWDDEPVSAAQDSSSQTKKRGVGVAAHQWIGGGGSAPAYSWIKLNSDGTADVITGAQDIGTGTRIGLAQVAAEELGLPLSQINLHLGDTAAGPYAPTSAGSATQASVGPAIRTAAVNARKQLLEAASLVLEEEAEKLSVYDGKVFVIEEPENSVSVAEVCGRIAPQMIQGQGARGENPDGKTVSTFGVQMAEVEVDTETGEVTILRLVAAHDCGRIINPKMVDSQVIGGITQGIGYTLTENRVIDAHHGIVLNPNLEEYKIPSVADIPPITHARVGKPDTEANNTGAKGIGESPIIPTAPAITNAIFAATGVRAYDLPVTQQWLVKQLASNNQSASKNGADV